MGPPLHRSCDTGALNPELRDLIERDPPRQEPSGTAHHARHPEVMQMMTQVNRPQGEPLRVPSALDLHVMELVVDATSLRHGSLHEWVRMSAGHGHWGERSGHCDEDEGNPPRR
jgi:hypothetical protein